MKKINKNIAPIIGIVSLLLGIAAIAMIFAPSIKYPIFNGEQSYTGMQVTFGFKEVKAQIGSGTYEVEWFKFSFMNLLTYVLLLAGVVLTLLKSLSGKKARLLDLVTAACFVVGGVFMLLTISYSVVGLERFTQVALLDKEKMTLGWGAIVGSIAAMLAGATKVGEALLS